MTPWLQQRVRLEAGPVARRHAYLARALLRELDGRPGHDLEALPFNVARCLDDGEVEGLLALLEAEMARRSAGEPCPTFAETLAGEAAWWADWASQAERKHYAIACFRTLPAADRVGFIRAAQKVALA